MATDEERRRSRAGIGPAGPGVTPGQDAEDRRRAAAGTPIVESAASPAIDPLTVEITTIEGSPETGTPSQLIATIAGGVPPYNILWSALRLAGGGTPPTFAPSPNVANPTVEYAAGAGELGQWEMMVQVTDAQG